MIQVILSIAGSDSGAGAGIQADLKSISACGGYGATVITAVTAQNTRGVFQAGEISPALIEAQIDAVFDDLTVAAVKTGMLSSSVIVETVARALRRRVPKHYVLDPVMRSKSGAALLGPEAMEILVRELFPLSTLVTPNRHEAERLADTEIRTPEDAVRAARRILDMGCGAVLVKGGHMEMQDAVDWLVTPSEVHRFTGPRLDARHTHGTGCTLSAAIATFLGRGSTLVGAVELAKRYVAEAIEAGLPLGAGQGPTDHFFYLRHSRASEWIDRFELENETISQGRNGNLHG